MIIKINVNDKIASNVNSTPIVCNNNNYILQFDLDDEWSGYEEDVKVVYNIDGEPQEPLMLQQDVDGIWFTTLPIIPSGRTVLVGLYCDESSASGKIEPIYTTSSARIDCIKSILNYNANMENPNNYKYLVRYEDGELHLYKSYGPGAMQFIETVEFPAAFNIDPNTGDLMYNFSE